MKSKTARYLALLLTVMLVAGVFSACGGTPAPSAAPSAAAAPSASASAEASAAPASSAQEPLKIHAMLIMYQQPPSPDSAFWKDMENKYNIDYQADWVQDTAYSDKLALVLSTNSLPDIVQIANTTEASVVKAIEAGQFKELTPYLDFNKYQNLGKISASAWTNSKYKGKNYVFPRSRGQYNDSIMLRGDILKKHNLKVPETIDEFTEYLRACKSETGMIPFAHWIQKDINRFQPCFGDGNVVPVYTDDKTGIVPQHLTESFAKTVEWIRGLYSEGLLAKEFAMFDDSQTENAFISGKTGVYFKNVWHRYRLNDELKKTVSDGEATPIFSLTGPGGTALCYDKGFYGGIMVNAKLEEDRFLRLLDFFNQTADPNNYFYFTYGLEGTYYTLVDGFPQLTEEGQKVVNNSFYCPYVLATDMYNKVDSPLAPPDYNKETREIVKVVDQVADKMGYAPFMFFDIISSKAYSDFWALTQDEFLSNVVDAITGAKSMDDFRAYQQQLLKTPEVQQAEKEFKVSWDEFGLANWTPPKAS